MLATRARARHARRRHRAAPRRGWGPAGAAGGRGPRMSAPAIRADGTVLGCDVGARRIGVAVGSAYGHGARALGVVEVHEDRIDWAAVARLQKEWCPDGPVVGDPMTLEGGE